MLTAWARPLALLLGVTLSVGALALGAGCDRQPTLVIRKLLVDVEPAAEARTDREAVRDTARRLIRSQPTLRLEEGKESGAVMRVRVFLASEGRHPSVPGAGVPADAPEAESDLGEAAEHGQPAMVSLTILISGQDGEGKRFQYRGAGVAQASVGPGRAANLDALQAEALQAAMDEVVVARSAADLPSSELIARLEGPNSSAALKRQAIQALGSRQEKAATPALARVLLGPDRELANTALRALTDIGDPNSVDAIIEYADGKPALIRKQAIEAVRALGTHKGQAWLFTLSTGHPDPDVQNAASTAFAALASVDDAPAKERPGPGG